MDQKHGYFVISLDFELFWGMIDKETLASYGARIEGERTAIPRMLDLFRQYGIHATWATVGMLMARNRDELMAHLPPPELRPTYNDPKMSSYEYLKTAHLGTSEENDIYHFGSDLVNRILSTPFQTIGNHTFSHYYCIDGEHNDPTIFKADLDAHARISETYAIQTETIVFPRNQTNTEALSVCATQGLLAYRGNEPHLLYKARKDGDQSLFIRIIRLLDHYVNISGHNTYPLPTLDTHGLMNIPASRFLRPWNRFLSLLEPLRMRRIKNAMTHAAKQGEVFHLWWHPHNFGVDQEQNFKNLTEILEHFLYLKNTYGMESASMENIAHLQQQTT